MCTILHVRPSRSWLGPYIRKLLTGYTTVQHLIKNLDNSSGTVVMVSGCDGRSVRRDSGYGDLARLPRDTSPVAEMFARNLES